MPSVGTCTRCGRFVCVRCVPDLAHGGKAICPECVERTEYAEALAKVPKMLRSIPVWFGIIALVYLAFGVAVMIGAEAKAAKDASFSRSQDLYADATVFAAVCILAALGMVAMIVMLIRAKDAGWGWAALLFMIGPVVADLALGGGGGESVIVFIGAVIIAWRLMRLQGYQAMIKQVEARKAALAQRPTVI